MRMFVDESFSRGSWFVELLNYFWVFLIPFKFLQLLDMVRSDAYLLIVNGV